MAAAVSVALPAGTALKNRATLPDSCDFVIQCGRHPVAPEGHALTDSFDPAPTACAFVTHGTPVKGLGDAAG